MSNAKWKGKPRSLIMHTDVFRHIIAPFNFSSCNGLFHLMLGAVHVILVGLYISVVSIDTN